jgi:peptidoglycan/xylan/chitin deacetylase (PgdA/CDA1 family)
VFGRDSDHCTKFPPVVTTSWDDGVDLDLRVAHRLSNLGLKGTFYIARRADRGRALSRQQISELSQIPGVEIGAHTLNHIDLRRADTETFRSEVLGSRHWLEDIVGQSVTSFCFPKGFHYAKMRHTLHRFGFTAARTTMSCRTDLRFDPLLMPTTLHFYPHRGWAYPRHALREGNWRGIANVLFSGASDRDPMAMLGRMLNLPGTEYIHLWGHSWEIDDIAQWENLDRCLERLKELAATPITNGEAAALVRDPVDT